MDTELKMALRWEIDNFSERNNLMRSDTFSSGGCEWIVTVYPKGCECDGRDDLSMYLHDVNTKSLRLGWKRRALFCFVLLNQSGKELFRSSGQHISKLFCAEAPCWGSQTNLTLTKLQEEGFLEKNKLIIQVYFKVVEVVHQGKSTENDTLDFNAFRINPSQAIALGNINSDHSDFALGVIPKNQGVKTAYMNLLLGLVETLSKSPQTLSVTELSNAQSDLTDLTEAGFKLDWLKSKLEELSLERKKAVADGSWVQQLEARLKDAELALSEVKAELHKEKIKYDAAAKVFSFDFIDFLIKRFFLSCFSVSKH